MAASQVLSVPTNKVLTRMPPGSRKVKNPILGAVYLVVDVQEGYVHGVHTAPANQSEMTHFEAAITGASIQANRVYADKGSASSTNRQFLKKCKIKCAIMHRAYKNQPLSARQILANKLISKKRTIVEQCFDTAKRLFGMRRASYFSTAKVNAQVIMKKPPA